MDKNSNVEIQAQKYDNNAVSETACNFVEDGERNNGSDK